MIIEFDPQKDARNIAAHGISLADAETLLTGFTVERIDDRRDYGEIRIIAIGEIDVLEYVCVYTQRGGAANLTPQSQKKGTQCPPTSNSSQPSMNRIGRCWRR